MPIPNGNPQIEDGHIDIANELAEALAKIRISGEEWQVLWAILRKTYGWHKKEDWIPLSQFQELTNIEKPHIIRAIKKLIAKNIIAKKGNENGKTYGFNKHYLTWKPLPKKAILIKVANIGNTIAKNGNPSLPKMAPSKENTSKETNTKENNTYQFEYEIFDFWNSLKKEYPRLQGSRNFEGVKENISAKLKIYSAEDIKRGMENYAKILENKKEYFWWSTSWSLKNFLLRGTERFVPENFDILSYVEKKFLSDFKSMQVLGQMYREEEKKEVINNE